MKNYYIETDNIFSLNKKQDEIIKESNFEEATKSIYDLEETELNKALEDLDTYSFLSNKKIIIIHNIDKYKNDNNEIDHLIKYLDNPNEDNLLILTSTKMDKKLKLYKKIKETCICINPEYNSKEIIKELLKEYKISISDIEYLIELCDEDQLKIKNECEKLKMYCIDTKKISKKEIDEIVTKKYGDSQNLVFTFVRNIAENDKKNAIKIYRELINYGRHPLEIVSLISSQLRTLLKIKIMEEENYTKLDISKALNKKPFYVEKQLELTRLYKLEEIRYLIKELQEIDMKMKTTDLDYNILIEMYIINI